MTAISPAMRPLRLALVAPLAVALALGCAAPQAVDDLAEGASAQTQGGLLSQCPDLDGKTLTATVDEGDEPVDYAVTFEMMGKTPRFDFFVHIDPDRVPDLAVYRAKVGGQVLEGGVLHILSQRDELIRMMDGEIPRRFGYSRVSCQDEDWALTLDVPIIAIEDGRRIMKSASAPLRFTWRSGAAPEWARR